MIMHNFLQGYVPEYAIDETAIFISNNKGMSYAYGKVSSIEYDEILKRFKIEGLYDDKIKIGKNMTIEFSDLTIHLNTEEDARKVIKHHREILKRMKRKEIKDSTVDWEN